MEGERHYARYRSIDETHILENNEIELTNLHSSISDFREQKQRESERKESLNQFRVYHACTRAQHTQF